MSQYQHYVPQTILRKFTSFVKPRLEDYANRQDWNRDVQKAKKKAHINVLEFDNSFNNGQLKSRATTKTFGILNMYDADVEKQFSTLEQQNSKVIEKIEQDFFAHRASTTITRPEKNVLRKFIFIMMFRNCTFYEQYRMATDEYDANDRRI